MTSDNIYYVSSSHSSALPGPGRNHLNFRLKSARIEEVSQCGYLPALRFESWQSFDNEKSADFGNSRSDRPQEFSKSWQLSFMIRGKKSVPKNTTGTMGSIAPANTGLARADAKNQGQLPHSDVSVKRPWDTSAEQSSSKTTQRGQPEKTIKPLQTRKVLGHQKIKIEA